jgi:hypothetical protein
VIYWMALYCTADCVAVLYSAAIFLYFFLPFSHPPLSSYPPHIILFPAIPTFPPQATKLLKKSVKTNPSHAASWVALARIHQRTGQVMHCTVLYCCACMCTYTCVSRAFIHRHVYGRVEIRLYISTRASPSFRRRLNGGCI